MAALLVESLTHKRSSFQIAIRAIELLLLSTGLVSSFLMLKEAVSPYNSYDFMLSNLRKSLYYFKSWLSSPLFTIITTNFIVILIRVSSLLHHQRMDNENCDIEDGCDIEDYGYFHSDLSPSSSPTPMQNSHQKKLQMEPKPKDIVVVTETTKNHHDIKATNDHVEEVDESNHIHEIFSDFSGLTEAKEFKKAPTTKGGSKIKSATANNQQDTAEDTNGLKQELFQAVFSDFSELTEAKEIKKACSIDPSSQVVTIQKNTRKIGQKIKNEKQNQLQQMIRKKQDEVRDEKEDDTMEATWRAITEKGAKPQQKQLKKSDTWPQPQPLDANQGKNNELEENMSSSSEAAWKDFRKSMTFNDTISIRCRGGLTRDPSMNLEEFNQRVEAFIKKFNQEMRLQRQESEQRYFDMIGRGL